MRCRYDTITFAHVTKLSRDRLSEIAPRQFISGMALGWALALVSVDLGISFVAAVAFKSFGSRWPKSSPYQATFLLCLASERHSISETSGVGAMNLRNRWMVDRSGRLVALWDGSFAGTFNCLQYAERLRRPVNSLRPRWELRRLLY